MTSAQLVPAVVVSFVVWRVVVRVKRNVGRQPLQPKRMIARIVFFGVITLLVGAASLTYLPSLAALAGGILLGVPLALVGLHLTRFEATTEGKFYTPNTFIGLAVTVMLVGRIAYRMVVLFGASPAGSQTPPALFQSPLTLLLFGATAGYYIAYFAGVLTRARKIEGS